MVEGEAVLLKRQGGAKKAKRLVTRLGHHGTLTIAHPPDHLKNGTSSNLNIVKSELARRICVFIFIRLLSCLFYGLMFMKVWY